MVILKRFLWVLVLKLTGATVLYAASDELVLGIHLEPPHLDPTAGAAGAIDEVVYANVFEGLTRIGSDGSVQPGLAASWLASSDGLEYIFQLRRGVKFHDGSDFDASDAKFSLDRARAEDSVNAQKRLFAQINDVEVMDANTLKVSLKKAQSDFLYNMGWGDAVIVAPETADTNKVNPIGTGPFKFDHWSKGQSITLVRNNDYWGDEVALQRAEFRFLSDAATALPAILSGDVDALANLQAGDAVFPLLADSRFVVKIGVTEGETILAINNAKAPFSQLKVRQAIAHALDRDAIIQGSGLMYGTPIGSHFSPTHEAYVDLTHTYPHNPTRAKELLAEAGFPEGFRATLKLPPPIYARESGQVVAAQLREVGIMLEIIPVEWAQWLEQVFRGKDYDLTIVSHTEPNDIGIYAREDYYFQYNNPDFNDIIDKLEVTVEPQKRKELYGGAQALLANDAVNGFLFQLPKIGVRNAGIVGLWENAPIQANDLTQVRWRDEISQEPLF